MALLASTLENALALLPTVMTEQAAIANISAAYTTYAMTAGAGSSIPIVAGAVTVAQSACVNAMGGLSVPSMGATSIFNGLVAFWASIALTPPSAFLTATAITPPPLAGLVASLTSVFATNTSGSLSLKAATAAVADAIHAQTLIGGTATFPGTPPVVLPIL